jgi:glycosyltransferase involved in cell wall biosynthesis
VSADPQPQRLRILHVITKLDVGGAQSIVAELVREQITSGHSVTVATGVVWEAAEVPKIDGVRLVKLSNLVHQLSPKNDLLAITHLITLMRIDRFDVVHTHSSKGGLLGRIAARRSDIPSIYTAHGWPFQAAAPRGQRIQSLIGEWLGGLIGNEIVCVNRAEAELAARLRVGRRKHRHVIHNGISFRPPLAERALRQSGDLFKLVMVARLHPPKRADLVVEALRFVDSRISLTIVGDGELRSSVEVAARECGVIDRVHFAGLCDPTPYLEAADAFVLASDYEGMPVTVLEAMRAGLPIIANDLPGIREAVNGGSVSVTAWDGFLTAKTAKALASAIQALFDEPNLARKMGERSRHAWESQFTVSQSATAYETLYRSVLSQR